MKTLLVGYRAADLTPALLAGDVTCHTLDIYHRHAIEKVHHARAICSPHLPEGPWDLVKFKTGPKLMSGELALDLLQECHRVCSRVEVEFVGRERDRNDLLNKIKADPTRVRSFKAEWAASVPGGAASDYFAGLNFLSLAGASAIETADDATITQPLTVTADGAALTKQGDGALTLAATNELPARVTVAGGTLAAQFRTEQQTHVPDGALAFWTFDGEDPLRDVTGHGYDLVQAQTSASVQFSEENAFAGKSAWWQTPGAVLKCTNIVSATLQRMTVSLWVRLESKTYANSHIGMFSMRNKLDATGAATSFDLAYKGTINNTVMRECGIGNCFLGSVLTGIPKSAGGDISLQTWHMISITRDEARVRSYVDGVKCTDVNMGDAYRDDTLLNAGYMITLGGNISGSGSFREIMNQDGRLDNVALYSRCLSDAEIAALYAARPQDAVAQEVRVAEGATLDLRDSSLATALLGGAGTVADGLVTVTNTLAVDPSAPLVVDRLALPAETYVVDCGRTEENPLPKNGTYVVVRANEVTGSPSKWRVIGTGWAPGKGVAHAALQADAEHQNVVLELAGSGTMLILR